MLSIIVLLVRLWCTPVVTPDTIILPGDFPMAVIQQPKGDYLWISDEKDAFTQLSQPREEFDTKVFAIHTWGAINDLYTLRFGDLILYTEKTVDRECNISVNTELYRVTKIYKYQAIRPKDPATSLIDLATKRIYDVDHVARDMYDNNKKIVLQTCIYKNGKTAWGRLFIMLEKVSYSQDIR